MPKISPEWQFLVYPKSAIPNRKIEAWAIADIMADLVSGQPSSWGGVLTTGSIGNEWSSWARMDNDLQLTNVGFARFLPGGGVEFSPANHGRNMSQKEKGTAGLFVQPTVQPLQVASALGPITSSATPNATQIAWTPQSGAFSHANAPGTLRPSGILNMSNMSAPDVALSSPWAQGAGIHANIHAIGANSPTETGAIILRVSDKLQIVYRRNTPPALERLSEVNNGGFTTTQWSLWRVLDEAGECKLRGENYETALYELGGRIVWQVNDHATWLSEADNAEQDRPPGTAQPDLIRVADMSALIGGTGLTFIADNTRARLDIGRREATEPGYVSRTVTRRTAVGEMLEPVPVGSQPGGTGMDAELSVDGKKITYTVALTPSDDGFSMPMLTQFYLAYKPTWTNPVGNAYDISSVVTEASVSHAHPPVQVGTAGSITVDLALMYSTLPGAAPYLKDYNPIEIRGRWDNGEWRGITKGFFMGNDPEQSGYKNSARVTLQIQGPMARLKSPAGLVDGNCVPADYHYIQRLKAMGIRQAQEEGESFSTTYDENGNAISAGLRSTKETWFYGSHAAQLIIGQFLGPTFANKLNGDGNATKYLPNDHPPLLRMDDMAGTWLALAATHKYQMTVGSLEKGMKDGYFKPPFGQDALTWINQFAEDEYCIFTEGWPSRNTSGWPDLMYGTRDEIVRDAKLHEISGTNVEKLLASAVSYGTKPEKDINEVVVWCNPFGGQAPPFAPAVVQGIARLRPSHPRSAENTWKRSLVVESPLATTPARAQALAAIILFEAGGDQFVYPSYTFQGDATCLTGDVFFATDIGYVGDEDLWLRADRIEHEYTNDPKNGHTWTTSTMLRTMSQTEIRRFQRAIALGGG